MSATVDRPSLRPAAPRVPGRSAPFDLRRDRPRPERRRRQARVGAAAGSPPHPASRPGPRTGPTPSRGRSSASPSNRIRSVATCPRCRRGYPDNRSSHSPPRSPKPGPAQGLPPSRGRRRRPNSGRTASRMTAPGPAPHVAGASLAPGRACPARPNLRNEIPSQQPGGRSTGSGPSQSFSSPSATLTATDDGTASRTCRQTERAAIPSDPREGSLTSMIAAPPARAARASDSERTLISSLATSGIVAGGSRQFAEIRRLRLVADPARPDPGRRPLEEGPQPK